MALKDTLKLTYQNLLYVGHFYNINKIKYMATVHKDQVSYYIKTELYKPLI